MNERPIFGSVQTLPNVIAVPRMGTPFAAGLMFGQAEAGFTIVSAPSCLLAR